MPGPGLEVRRGGKVPSHPSVILRSVTRYNLDGLGAETFEDLVISLCLGVIGPGVTAFGAGPDGGREATFSGPINWSPTVLKDQTSWDGYTVIQAKYRVEPSSSKPTANAAWLPDTGGPVRVAGPNSADDQSIGTS